MELREEIRAAINRCSADNGSDTPDFILARYLTSCLEVFDAATRRRDEWYGNKGLRARLGQTDDRAALPDQAGGEGEDDRG